MMRDLLMLAVPWWAYVLFGMGVTYTTLAIAGLVMDFRDDARRRQMRHRPVSAGSGDRSRVVLCAGESFPSRLTLVSAPAPGVCAEQACPADRRRYREARQEAEARARLYPPSADLSVLPLNTYAPAAGTGRGV